MKAQNARRTLSARRANRWQRGGGSVSMVCQTAGDHPMGGAHPAARWGFYRSADAFARRALYSKAPAHCGASLIELVFVIGIASVLVGISVTTIHRLLAAEREHERMVRSAVQLARLSRQFRDDVHAAVEAEIAADPAAELKLAPASSATIVYTAAEATLTRVATDAGGQSHREVYRFPRETRFAFSQDADTSLLRLSVEVPRNPASQPAAGTPRPQTTVLESHLGLDRRLTGGAP